MQEDVPLNELLNLELERHYEEQEQLEYEAEMQQGEEAKASRADGRGGSACCEGC